MFRFSMRWALGLLVVAGLMGSGQYAAPGGQGDVRSGQRYSTRWPEPKHAAVLPVSRRL